MRRFRDNFSFFIFRFSLLAIAAVMTGCGVSIKYSLSGASIPPDAKTFSAKLFEAGIFATAIVFPTVPRGTARIRVMVSAAHSREDLRFAVDTFASVGREMGLLR